MRPKLTCCLAKSKSPLLVPAIAAHRKSTPEIVQYVLDQGVLCLSAGGLRFKSDPAPKASSQRALLTRVMRFFCPRTGRDEHGPTESRSLTVLSSQVTCFVDSSRKFARHQWSLRLECCGLSVAVRALHALMMRKSMLSGI